MGSQTVAEKTISNGITTLNWILSDQVNSTTVTANADGTWSGQLLYTAFGEIRSASGNTPTQYRFTSQLADSYIKLDWYASRFYDPYLNHFVQPDSVIPGLDNSNVPTDGIAWDHYLYAQNNPVRYNDPTGHCPWCIIIGIPVVGFAIGAASYQISTGTPWWSSKQALSGTVAAGAKGAATTIQAVVAIGALIAEGDPAPAEQVESEADNDLGLVAANVESNTPKLALPAPSEINSRSGEIISKVSDEETTAFRIWGGEAQKEGKWLSLYNPSSQDEAQQKLSLPPENSAEYTTKVSIPAGTRYQLSTAANIFGRTGGWPQIELLQKIPSSAYKETIPLVKYLSGE